MKHAALVVTFVLVLPLAAAGQSWGTYQGNASHTGYVPITIAAERGIQHLWSREFAGPLNPVAIGDGRIFVSESTFFTAGRGLHAVDAHTGATAWSHPDFGEVSSVNPPAYANGAVYLQTGRDTLSAHEPSLHAFDGATGTARFTVPFEAQWGRFFAPTSYLGDVFSTAATMAAPTGSMAQVAPSAGLPSSRRTTSGLQRSMALTSTPTLASISRGCTS